MCVAGVFSQRLDSMAVYVYPDSKQTTTCQLSTFNQEQTIRLEPDQTTHATHDTDIQRNSKRMSGMCGCYIERLEFLCMSVL
jgi:hypothetical protein